MTFPFRIVPPTGLPITGYTWSTLGVFPAHRLACGRYLRRTLRGWTKHPETLVASALFGTAKQASAGRDRFMAQLRRHAMTPGPDRRAT